MHHDDKAPVSIYRRKFREEPSFCMLDVTHEMWEEFERLMLMAIERGKPLTRAECHAVHNFDDYIGSGAVV